MGFQCRQCNIFLFKLLPFVKLDFYISDIAWDSESDRHLENWEWDCIEAALWSVTLLLLSPRGIPRPVWSAHDMASLAYIIFRFPNNLPYISYQTLLMDTKLKKEFTKSVYKYKNAVYDFMFLLTVKAAVITSLSSVFENNIDLSLQKRIIYR